MKSRKNIIGSESRHDSIRIRSILECSNVYPSKGEGNVVQYQKKTSLSSRWSAKRNYTLKKSDIRNFSFGFTMIELVITLTVASILMLGMLPLIRFSTESGAIMQVEAKKIVELQSVMERLTAANFPTNVTLSSFKSMAGSGTENNSYGSYYVHESEYVRFNASGNEVASTNGAGSGLLKLRIGLDSTGASLEKIFYDTN